MMSSCRHRDVMRMKRAVFVLALLGLALALAAGCAQQPGQVELSATEYDFGTIPNTAPSQMTRRCDGYMVKDPRREARTGPLPVDAIDKESHPFPE